MLDTFLVLFFSFYYFFPSIPRQLCNSLGSIALGEKMNSFSILPDTLITQKQSWPCTPPIKYCCALIEVRHYGDQKGPNGRLLRHDTAVVVLISYHQSPSHHGKRPLTSNCRSVQNTLGLFYLAVFSF